MRFAFWNIRAGGGRRIEWIAEQVKTWRPDVLGLCEFRGTAASQTLAGVLADQRARYVWGKTKEAPARRHALSDHAAVLIEFED